MSDNAFEINTTITGGAQQQNIAQSGGQASLNVDQRSGGVSFAEFIRTLKEQIPAEQLPEAADVIEQLEDIATQPEPETSDEKQTLMSRIGDLVKRLEPYTPYIRKTIAAFAEGALLTLPPPSGWIISGCIEVIRDARNK